MFFKCMASTISTFPPELAVEANKQVFNIVSEIELRTLKANKTNTNSSPAESVEKCNVNVMNTSSKEHRASTQSYLQNNFLEHIL